MRIALETSETKTDSSAYYEFFYGKWNGEFCGAQSVYLEVSVFELVSPVIEDKPGFNPYGPGTLSATSARQIAEELGALSSQVAKADRPQEVWGAQWRGMAEDLEIESWPPARKRINAMLRDLTAWFRVAADSDQVVTVLGL